MNTYYVYPDYEVYYHPPEWKSDDYVVIEAYSDEEALIKYLEMEKSS